MPGKRGPSQTLIAFPVEENLFAEVESARGRKSRSQWCREAVVEKLQRMGFDVPEDLMYPPDRSRRIVVKNSPGGIQQIGGVGHRAEQTNFLGGDPAAQAKKNRKRRAGTKRKSSKRESETK